MQGVAFKTKPKQRTYVTATDPKTRKSRAITVYGMTVDQFIASIVASGREGAKAEKPAD